MTMGGLVLRGGDVQKVRSKTLLLLTFLAVEGPTARRRLRKLFWPNEDRAAASLRVVIHQLRQAHSGLITGEDLLEAQVECDAVQLMDTSAVLTPQQVFGLYRGPFLHGVRLTGFSDELVEWVDRQREMLALTAQRAGIAAAETAVSPAQAERAAQLVYRLPGAAPLPLDDLQRLLELSAPGGALEHELRTELSELVGTLSSYSSPHVLKSDPEFLIPAGLIGRQHETGVLLGYLSGLSGSDARLIEVTGPGGVGKTTLVDGALREHTALSTDRVASIDIEGFRDVSSVATRIAQALGVPLNDNGDAWQTLGRYLVDRPTLLALHGTEHLPELTAVAERLLDQVDSLRIVVTSRIRMTSGIHLSLGGLALPPAGAGLAILLASPTVQLFVRAARRSGVNIALQEDDAQMVSAIARRLDGHPLALCMTGGWTRSMSLRQIYSALLPETGGATPKFSPDISSAPLQAVFARSWGLLGPSERRALIWCSVFADVTTEDAASIAHVEATTLSNLEAHSLVRRRHGRWQVFPVLAPLVPGESGDLHIARSVHAHAYLERLMQSPGTGMAELANIHLAVQQGLATGTLSGVMIDALLLLHDRSGLLSVGSEVFGRLVAQASEVNALPGVQAGLLIAQGWIALRASRLVDAEILSRRALEQAGQAEDPIQPGHAAALRMKALNVLSSALYMTGQIPLAVPMLREAADLAHTLDDPIREARYLANLGTFAKDTGDFIGAEHLLLRAIALLTEVGEPVAILLERLQLLNLRVDALTLDVADLCTEAQDLFAGLNDMGVLQGACMARITQARLWLQQDVRQADSFARDARKRCRSLKFPIFEAAAALVEAEALYRLGQTPQARRAALWALEVCVQHDDMQGQMESWVVLAADLTQTRPALSRSVLGFVRTSAQASVPQRRRAEAFLEAGEGVVIQDIADTERTEFLHQDRQVYARLSAQVRSAFQADAPSAHTQHRATILTPDFTSH